VAGVAGHDAATCRVGHVGKSALYARISLITIAVYHGTAGKDYLFSITPLVRCCFSCFYVV
jgi:hypothetical protein